MNAQKKSTHTPGPWSRNIRAGGKYPTVFSGRNQYVAHVVQQADPAETEANIDLIAAAPDLLAALRELLALNPHAIGAASARAAIAKATGGAP